MKMHHPALVVAMLAFGAAAADGQTLSVSLPVSTQASGERIGAGEIILDVSGTQSVDARGSSNNFVTSIYIGRGNTITGIGWDVTLQTVHPASYLSDMAVGFSPAGVSGEGFVFTPGALSQFPGGPASFSSNGEIVKLADVGIPLLRAGEGGRIRVEFFERIDDGANVPDGVWVSGRIRLQTWYQVPAPASAAFALVAGRLAVRRRRS